METRHTQGEWKTYESENVAMPFEIVSEGTKIARIVNETEAEANAKLIAAAPELLKQLKVAVSILKESGITRGQDQMEQVIKKATE